ncbi:protein FLORAL ORGAN NUMBER2-like [Miscanthus floridulus]|uniref:protein FLORAL ORGAN NUMBER2-like n=1 Tax=Miscanthus floridulus TaxID=154761 RepID=UPI00345926F9
MARIFLCLAAACCCLALLPPPAQGRRPGHLAAPAAGGLGGRSRLHLLRVPEPHFDATEAAEEEPQQRGVPGKARSAWSPAAGSVRPELRAVPGGPDPLHHHGGSPSRRPEKDRTPSP